MAEEKPAYTVWIETESWVPGSWDRWDANPDVIVRWKDGRRWGATCVSYQNVKTLQQKNTRTGESLSGAYLWARFLILVDEVSRQRIEAVISDLLNTGQFESAFEELADDLQS